MACTLPITYTTAWGGENSKKYGRSFLLPIRGPGDDANLYVPCFPTSFTFTLADKKDNEATKEILLKIVAGLSEA